MTTYASQYCYLIPISEILTRHYLAESWINLVQSVTEKTCILLLYVLCLRRFYRSNSYLAKWNYPVSTVTLKYSNYTTTKMIANDEGWGTVPSGGRSRLKNGLEIIVPGADQDGALEIERHRLASLHQQILTVTHVVQGPPNPSAANNCSWEHLGGGRCGHGQSSESADSVPGKGYWEVGRKTAREWECAGHR